MKVHNKEVLFFFLAYIFNVKQVLQANVLEAKAVRTWLVALALGPDLGLHCIAIVDMMIG